MNHYYLQADYSQLQVWLLGKRLALKGKFVREQNLKIGIHYIAVKNMKFQLGLSEMFGTETLGYLQGNTNTNDYKKNGTWTYLMLNFSPNFHTS